MTDNSVICVSDGAVYYYAVSEGRVTIDGKKFRSIPFDEGFRSFFTDAAAEFSRKYAASEAANTTLVIPDSVIFTDVLKFPPMKGRALRTAVKMAIAGNYKNQKELKINARAAAQTRQFAAYRVTGVRREIPAALRAACREAGFSVQNVTFAANAAVTGLNVLNSKFRSKTFLFLDVKENTTRYVYVLKGKAVAFTSLPFGFSTLGKNRVAAEDLLLYRPCAELAVLNARERARAKELTTAESYNAENDAEDEDGNLPFTDSNLPFTGSDSPFTGSESPVSGGTAGAVKVLPRKTARKLPKFMLRDPPEGAEATAYENFRLFVKWSLCFIAGNGSLTALGAPSAVVVNMPRRFDFLFDMANAEESENGIKFVSAGLDGEKEDISLNLEMYGGLFSRNADKENNF